MERMESSPMFCKQGVIGSIPVASTTDKQVYDRVPGSSRSRLRD